MWIIHDQIEAKRYQRWPLNEIPRDNPNARYFDDELLPGGLIEAPGRLSVDTVDGSGWGGLGVTLPTDSSTPIVGTRQKPLSKQKRGRRPDTDVADDERVFQAWQTGQYLSKAALAKSLGAPWDAKKVIAAVDRHRKRLKCATAKSSSDN